MRKTNVRAAGRRAGRSRIVTSPTTGAVLAFDVAGLVALATRADCLIELVPQVGEFVTEGDPLFRVSGGRPLTMAETCTSAVAIGGERTMQQDPGFAFRIVVDIASKALSPAINDPTTGVLALDQIHRLLRTVADAAVGFGPRLRRRRAVAAGLPDAGLGRLRQPVGHRDSALRPREHPDCPPHAGHAREPDRGGAAATGGAAAQRNWSC